MPNDLDLKIHALAIAAARAAHARGDMPSSARLYVQRDEDPDKNVIYSLWRVLPFGQSELVDVLEEDDAD